jgi:Immunoglobulin domain
MSVMINVSMFAKQVFFTLFSVAPTLAKTSPKVVSVKGGTLASLYCEGQGRPQPEVTWFKDGTDHMILATPPEVFQGNLSHDGGTHDVHGRGMSLARVSSVIRPTEPGLYTCLMKNLAGHVTFNISLYVEGTYGKLHADVEKKSCFW